MEFSSDIAFTPAVKALQERQGSRHAYARMEEGGAWDTRIGADQRAFIEAQDSAFLASANALGQPYVQHRGGPAGFLRVLDERTIGFADYTGNRQYITLGNLSENDKVHLFLIDYAQRQRLKIWGTARVEHHDGDLLRRLMPTGYKARAEQAIVITVSALDANCPQHIAQRFAAADVSAALASRDSRIASLEEELRRLRAGASSPRQRGDPAR